MISPLLPIEDIRLMLPVGDTGRIAGEFSPDGKYVATVGGGPVNIWDISSGKLIRTIDGHFHYVTTAHFSPDGKYLATASWDKTAKIWEVSTGKMLHAFIGHADVVQSATFSPACPNDPAGGKYLATRSNDETVRIWISETGRLHSMLNVRTTYLRDCLFSPDGRHLLINHGHFNEAAIEVWDILPWKRLYSIEGPDYGLSEAQYNKCGYSDSIGGKLLFTFSSTTAYIWDSLSGELLRSISNHSDGNQSYRAHLSPDGKSYITATEGADKILKLWDIESGQLLQSFHFHQTKIQNKIESIQFSPPTTEDPAGGKTLVTIGWDKIARVWDTRSRSLLHTLEGHSDDIVSSQFSKDGELILTTSSDHTNKIWNANSGQLLHTLSGSAQSVTSANFALSLKQIHVYYGDQTLRIWDVTTGKIIRSKKSYIKPIASTTSFSPDGQKCIAGSTDCNATIRKATSGEVLCVLQGHTARVHTAKFSPACEDDPQGGRYIVTASCDYTAKVWDAESGTLLHTLAGHSYCVESAQFNPDGKLILTSSMDRTAKIWDTHSGKLLKSFPITGYDIIVSSDWTRLLSINGATISMYDLATGRELLSWMAVGEKDWVVVHPSGLVDASPGVMEKLYWVSGMTIVDSSILKERYVEPGLWEKVMRGEKLKSDQ